MTERAAEVFERGRHSTTDSQEAWERLGDLSTEVEWNVQWLHSDSGEEIER